MSSSSWNSEVTASNPNGLPFQSRYPSGSVKDGYPWQLSIYVNWGPTRLLTGESSHVRKETVSRSKNHIDFVFSQNLVDPVFSPSCCDFLVKLNVLLFGKRISAFLALFKLVLMRTLYSKISWDRSRMESDCRPGGSSRSWCCLLNAIRSDKDETLGFFNPLM